MPIHVKIKILHSENSNFALKNLKWCSKQTAQNSALKQWKFWAQEMEIWCSENGKFPQHHEKSAFSTIFHDKSENFTQFYAAMLKSKFHAKFHDRRILEWPTNRQS